MSNKMKLSIIFTCLVLIFLVTPVNSFVNTTIQNSPALVTIFNQAEATYMVPLGINKQTALDKYPDIFAGLVGMTLQRQFKYLRSNGDYISRYNVLENEALAFMHQLAKAHSYRHPTDGSNLPEARMGVKFYDGLNGNSNIYFIEKFGIDPAKINLPFMLSQVPLPKNTGGDNTEHGKLHVKKKNEINLLGQKAPPTESDSPYVGKPSRPEPQVSSGPCHECPKTQPGNEDNFRLYCDDGGYVGCRYFENRKLSAQYPKFWGNNQKTHGIHLDYEIKGTTYYLRKKTDHKNGKRHGPSYTWSINDTTGRPYLTHERNYFNGKMHGTSKNWKIEQKSGRVYLHTKYQYVNGKLHGFKIQYYPNGAEWRRTKYIDGKFIETTYK